MRKLQIGSGFPGLSAGSWGWRGKRMPIWLRVLGSRIRGFVLGHRVDGNFDRELQSHLEMLTEENVRRGMAPEEARRAACLRLGGVSQIKESDHELRGLPVV